MDADPLKMTPPPGRLSTSHTEKTTAHVREIIRADQRLTIREFAEDGIAFGTCQKILTEDLQIRHVSAKFVPHLLAAEQKDDCLSIFLLTSVSEPKTIRTSCPQ